MPSEDCMQSCDERDERDDIIDADEDPSPSTHSATKTPTLTPRHRTTRMTTLRFSRASPA